MIQVILKKFDEKVPSQMGEGPTNQETFENQLSSK
jgi:hypothetical protein